MKKNTRQRLLELVVARLGWRRAAKRLEIDPDLLDEWLSGASRMPDDKLVRLVDLIDQTNEDLG